MGETHGNATAPHHPTPAGLNEMAIAIRFANFPCCFCNFSTLLSSNQLTLQIHDYEKLAFPGFGITTFFL